MKRFFIKTIIFAFLILSVKGFSADIDDVDLPGTTAANADITTVPAQLEDPQQAFFDAICTDDVESVRKLLSSQNVDVNALGTFRRNNGFMRNELTPLYSASRCGYLGVVELLLNAGADINSRDGVLGHTALEGACIEGHSDIVEFLFSKGATIEGQELCLISGSCCLNVDGSLAIVKFLISKGAGVNVKDPSEFTALHIACFRGDDLGIVELLIGAGADVNQINHYGETALHRACECMKYHTGELPEGSDTYLSIVKLLIGAGADVYRAANVGETPLEVARRCKNQEIVQFIEKHIREESEATRFACLTILDADNPAVVNCEYSNAQLILLNDYHLSIMLQYV